MCADLAVHHPARRDDVGAGGGLGERRPWRRSRAWRRCRRRRARRARRSGRGRCTRRRTGRRSARRRRRGRRAGRPAPAGRCPSGSNAPLPIGVLVRRDPEQDDRPDAERGQLGDLLAQALAGVLDDAGQRHDRLRVGDALADEQRGDRGRSCARTSRRRGRAGPACGAAGAAGRRGTGPGHRGRGIDAGSHREVGTDPTGRASNGRRAPGDTSSTSGRARRDLDAAGRHSAVTGPMATTTARPAAAPSADPASAAEPLASTDDVDGRAAGRARRGRGARHACGRHRPPRPS